MRENTDRGISTIKISCQLKMVIQNTHSIQNLNIWQFQEGNNVSQTIIEFNNSDCKIVKSADINESFYRKDGRFVGRNKRK
jgi:hypothetical protein